MFLQQKGMKKSLLSFLFLFLCASLTGLASAEGDPHSFSEPDVARVTHLDLDIDVDFEQRALHGRAVWDFERTSGDRIVFDIKDMEIRSVTAGEKPLSYCLGEPKPWLGRPLTIELPEGVEQVTIEYVTKPEAGALQWLDPVQTAGKVHPFLFTQSQAILARTWIPIQDSPGVRFTYEASVRVPPELLAVMSAENPTEKNREGTYSFSMPQPISSYLMALAVGDLTFQSLGENTGVYAEPSELEKSAYEFADTQKMVDAMSAIFGPYRWGRYDLLVLPPSFPFGGMENPRLTFLTPTAIAGDRSLTTLIAHELAHSWSGNLVTNADWTDFWLNEGSTVYLERRVMEELYGKDYAAMIATLGYGELSETLAELPAEDTHLKLELTGRDPDEGLTDVAYEKGYFFLANLEEKVGRKKFDRFMREYFDDNAFGTITTEKFLERVKDRLGSDLEVEKWVYSPGLPNDFVPPKSVRFDAVDKEMKAYLGGRKRAKSLNTKGWTTYEWLRFLRSLPQKPNLIQMVELDRTFKFSESGNSEILAEWLLASIRADYKPAYPALERFLVNVGRRKFLVPLYQELAKTPAGLKRAHSIYSKARPNYHSVSVGTVDEIVKWQER